MDFIRADDPEAVDHCNDLAKRLVIRTGDEKEPHWNDSAEMWIAAVILTVVIYGNAKEGSRSLQTVREILSDAKKLDLAIKLMLECQLFGGVLTRMGGQLMHFVDKEKTARALCPPAADGVNRHPVLPGFRSLTLPAPAEILLVNGWQRAAREETPRSRNPAQFTRPVPRARPTR